MVFQTLYFRRDAIRWEVVYGTSRRTSVHGISGFEWLVKQDMGSKVILTRVGGALGVAAEWGMGGGLGSHGILQWFRAFPLAHLKVVILESLTDDIGDIDNKYLWEEVFWDTPELHIIQLEYGYIEGLIRALHPRDGVIPAPTLTDNALEHIKFERDECLGGRNHVRGKGCLGCLHSALARRAEAGIFLQRLNFGYSTGVMKEDVTEFSKVVGQLIGPTGNRVGK